MNVSLKEIVDVVTKTEQLEKRMLHLERLLSDQQTINKELEDLKKTIEELAVKVGVSQEEKCREVFYQRELEKYFGGKHATCEYSIIDILTDDSIIEIKHWSKYKDALGQVQAYGLQYSSHTPIVVFFGEVRESKRSSIVKLFSRHDIKVKEVREENSRISVENVSSCSENNEFLSWLDENIYLKENGLLNLKDVCRMYTGIPSIPSRISSKYKKEIEQYIKRKYNTINEKYKDSSFSGQRYKGWLGLSIKDK